MALDKKGKFGSYPTGVGTLKVTIEHDNNDKPFDIRTHVGKPGSDSFGDCDAIARLANLCLQAKVPMEKIYKQLLGIGGDNPIPHGKTMVRSVPDALGKALRELYPPEEKK